MIVQYRNLIIGSANFIDGIVAYQVSSSYTATIIVQVTTTTPGIIPVYTFSNFDNLNGLRCCFFQIHNPLQHTVLQQQWN